jgi:ABC-type sugar transport system substrate-binding protein
MLFALVACTKKDAPPAATTPTAAPATPAPGGDAPGGDTAPPAGGVGGGRASFNATDYFGFFNPDFDYSGQPSYKFVFISMAWDNLTQQMSGNFEGWSAITGSEYISTSCDSNVETMISNIELYASQGYDGFIINAYDAIMDRVNDLCEENDLTWWSLSELARTSDGVLHQPYVVTNAKQFGYDLVMEEVAWMKENVPDFDPAQTMIVTESLTTIKEFTDRSTGAENAWKEFLPEAKFEITDGLAEGGISPEIGYNMAATRYTANPDVKFWIYAAVMDTFSPGILRFIEENKMEDRAILASCGGQDLIKLFDNGSGGAWRFAMCDDLAIRFNPGYNALYAVVAGWATYEEMWPDFRVPGETFSGIDIAFIKMTKDNYKDYLAFCDHFSGLNNWPNYEWSGKRYPALYAEVEAYKNGTLTY